MNSVAGGEPRVAEHWPGRQWMGRLTNPKLSIESKTGKLRIPLRSRQNK